MRRLSFFLAWFLVVVMTTSLLADQTWHVPKQTVDIEHFVLAIQIDEKSEKVEGEVTFMAHPLWDDVKEVFLDAREMNIHEVTLRGKNLAFQHDGKTLHIELDREYRREEKLVLQVRYAASPKRGMYFIQPNEAYPDYPYQVWTQGESEDNQYWFPCYDYPNQRSTAQINVTVRKPLDVISNGSLINVSQVDDTWHTFHWQMEQPFVSYLVSIVVGRFAKKEEIVAGVPLSYYFPEKYQPYIEKNFAKTGKMLKLLNSKAGTEYPYSKYTQVVVKNFLFRGMENVTATTLTEHCIHDDKALLDGNCENLIMHELAHQWWGDLLTCRDWSHIWLNEGFATYSEALWQEVERGEDALKLEMLGSYQWYISSSPRVTIWKDYNDVEDIFDSHAYAKGSWILHMLRDLVGDKDFFRAVQLYTRRHRNEQVVTSDLRYAFQDTVGKDLQWFFDQWLQRAGHPKFQVSYQWYEQDKMLMIHLAQTQEGKHYRLPVDIEVTTAKGSEIHRVQIVSKESRLYLPCLDKPLMVRFDKGGKILKELDFPKQEQELVYQLRSDSDLWGRLQAIAGLAKEPTPSALQALVEALTAEKLPKVRQKIAKSLGAFDQKSVTQALLKATEDEDSLVRAAAALALKEHEQHLAQQVTQRLQQLFAEDPSYQVRASALQALGGKRENEQISSEELLSLLEQALQTDSHREVIRQAAMEVFATIETEEALAKIESWMAYGKPRLVRTSALQAFEEVAPEFYSSEEIVQHVSPFLKDPYHKMREASIELLKELGHGSAIVPLMEVAKKDVFHYMRIAAKKVVKHIRDKDK